MTLTDELYAAAEPIWASQLQHPFVRKLGDGSLEESRFKRWVLQDYRYLKEFARVFAWATAKAEKIILVQRDLKTKTSEKVRGRIRIMNCPATLVLPKVETAFPRMGR